MPTALENLITARDNLAAELAAYVASKPDYSIGGQSVQWDRHYESLLKRMDDLSKQIQILGGPVEIVTQAVP